MAWSGEHHVPPDRSYAFILQCQDILSLGTYLICFDILSVVTLLVLSLSICYLICFDILSVVTLLILSLGTKARHLATNSI